MKTDRQFLMELFLEEGIPIKIRKRMAKHMGAEQKTNTPIKAVMGPIQSPSTQRLLDAQEQSIAHATASGILPVPVIPQIPVAKRIVGGSVNNGDGTTGKRKW